MKCPCFLLEALDGPRLRVLPLAAQMLWLRLARAAHAIGSPVLRFGSAPPTETEIALALPTTETELKANLPALLDAGLVTREPDGALAIPLLAERQKRSEINRANGLRGGRPRKDGTARAQSHLMLPLPGGRAAAAVGETEKTEPEPSRVPARAAAASDNPSPAAEAAAIGREVLRRIGRDPETWRHGFADVERWLAMGADRETILAVVEDRTEAAREPIGSLRYFTAAIGEAIEPVFRVKSPLELAHQAWWENDRTGPMPTLASLRAAGVAA